MISAQVMRFGVVGVSAMCVHMLVVTLLVPAGLHPLLANIIAFLVAFQVSYFGHARWTFSVADPNSRKHKLRFFIVAILSFLTNEMLYALLLTIFHLHYLVALFIVLAVVALLTFVLSRLWAFRE